MRRSGWYKHRVAGRHRKLVQRSEHRLYVLLLNPRAEHRQIDLLPESDVHARTRVYVDDPPCVGLAVRGSGVPPGEFAARMEVHRKPLARVEQLHEQARIWTE